MKPLVIAPVGRAIGGVPLGRREEDVEIRRVPAFPAVMSLDPERPTVIVVDRPLLHSVGGDRTRLEEAAAVAALVGCGDPGEHEPGEDFPIDLLTSWTAADAPLGAVAAAMRGAFRHAVTIASERQARRRELLRTNELTDLTRVGVALTIARDLWRLLDLILTQARRITGSDAGSLYLVERDADGHPEALRFKLSQNFSLPNLHLKEFTVPIDHASLAGYAAATGEPLAIADVYLLPEDASYRQNRSFDDKFGYRTKSMLVLPMKTHRDEVIGVLQLINRKRSPDARLGTSQDVEREVVDFDARAVELGSALASQAAVAIENSLLYESIERLFEGFVTAAVTAIESRDPATHGHSGRVATLSVALAEAVDRGATRGYRGTHFTQEQLRELRYAGLLHDFGKVGVREEVLVKEKKLYPADLALIKDRFSYLAQGVDLAFERKRTSYLLEHGRDGYRSVEQAFEQQRREERGKLQQYLDAIVRANEPSILPDGGFEELQQLARHTYEDGEGSARPLLTPHELRFLTIRQGTLDDSERREIESHVTHTFRFLQQIPWTRELRGVPDIAYGHHEKLNGRGYPRQVAGEAIPVQTRMMTIADIYDALTAADRPYKRAVSTERALDILHEEAREGLVDSDLLTTFADARVYERTGPGAGDEPARKSE